MKKRFFSILLCFCMVLGLLPATALAADYPDGWPSDPSSLVADTDTVTIDGITYTYKGDASDSGIEMTDRTDSYSYMALQEACCWKAGDGYVLYNPTPGGVDWYNVEVTTSAEVTLHDAEISTSGDYALSLPYNAPSSTDHPVDVTVKVEGENSLTTSDASYEALYHRAGYTTFSGGGILTLTNTAENPNCNFWNSKGDVTIENGTQVTISGGESYIIGNLTVTDSAKLTIARGTVLSMGSPGSGIDPNTCTVTVEDGTVLENNGTLNMFQKNKDEPSITGEISGSGGIVFPDESNTVYCLVDDKFIPYGGDIRESGLNISGKDASGSEDPTYNAPTVATRYKAGDGYALFTPAVTGDSPANAKLEFHDATIATTDATALTLPSTELVDITVTGTNSLTAGGSGNVITTNGQALSVTGGGNLSLEAPFYGVNVNGMGAISISIDGDLTFDTVYQPISTIGDITVSAKSITSKSGYYFNSGNGVVSLTATDGDIIIDDTEKTNKQEKIKGTNGITLNAPRGKIDITHGGSGCCALRSELGTITISALDDVIINASSGSDIYSGKSDTSDVVTVNSTNGSIQMSCGDYYECVEASGGVALAAAKDITLNGTENGSAAIQATGQTISITAGGKLSSTTAWGFQVGTLTIQADEVSIAGTSQDGVGASSVSITKDGTHNCKSVSITATATSNSWAAINSSNVTIKADDVLICGNNSAKAINAANINGTVTIGDAGMIIGAVSISGTKAINSNILMIESTGADASAGLDLSTPPDVITYYKAGNGYALFTPANGETKETLTLHNANITSASATPLVLSAETIIKLEGENSLTNSKSDGGVGIYANGGSGEPQPITIQGGSGDSLTVSAWQCTNIGALTIDGCSVTMDGLVYGMLTEGDVVLKNGAKVSASGGDSGGAVQIDTYVPCSLTVSDGSTLTVNEGDAYITGDLTISGSGSRVTINSGVEAMVLGTIKAENSGVLENNGTLQMKFGTTVDEIKALKLAGSGLVLVRTNEDGPPIWDTYTNEGVPVKEISGDLDLTTGGDSGDLTADGYHWDNTNNTLTLGDVFVSGSLTLPDDTIINTSSGSTISGGINGAGGTAMHLTFEGTAPLNINGIISLGSNRDTVTVQEGAHVTINGSLSLGVYDGTLNVIGSGTTLSISSDNSYAALCGEVNVESGASLTAKAAGSGSVGLKVEKINDASGNVSVSGGSTLIVGCDYGVYVKDGSFTIDESSTFTATADVAAVCVVDTTKMKTQSQTLNVPSSMLPSGTKITDAVGNTVGCGYHYFSIANSTSTLSATDENSSPATLAFALGALTLKKASSNNNNNGGSSGGSASGTNYTLTFETNGGAAISSVSKTSGTVVDLSGYKPTRDGYDFAGWYSDTALTTKVTSVTLTKSTTVYAKWTEKTVQSTNPFIDVADSAYYHDAVLWATERGITSGTTGTTFSPGMICTRAQAVTFLWKAMGAPEPTSANCPFTDVSADDYYYKAVLWAIEKGIVKGTSPTTFSPSATVTRSQSMTFLWRAAGETTSISANPFADVSKDAYYYNAVLWAVEKDITKGTSDTAFSPDGGCTRAQIITFLYRYMGK